MAIKPLGTSAPLVGQSVRSPLPPNLDRRQRHPRLVALAVSGLYQLPVFFIADVYPPNVGILESPPSPKGASLTVNIGTGFPAIVREYEPTAACELTIALFATVETSRVAIAESSKFQSLS